MADFSIFKVQYDWYEGEHREILVSKAVEFQQFEKDLIEAKTFAERLKGKLIEKGQYLGKGYRVECLPAFFEQIVWYLVEKLGYKYCHYDANIHYDVDDDFKKKIKVTKVEKKAELREIS